jgi:hypothetical protein
MVAVLSLLQHVELEGTYTSVNAFERLFNGLSYAYLPKVEYTLRAAARCSDSN